ncbi:50S ribosomal protein L3 [Desulfonatronovibrio hydrogenovorans]|uniref:50S ribosomal protein L3 n=1 Tax=Desulfonatronovibrio hydrogenovorans TaxID=53245 RepID=UPI00048AD0CC|nr:50S ribosomal protein L3 [Desulfonatronovibrio hydrogenovorans]
MKRTIGLIGKKIGMTSLFADDGTQVAVTVIQAGPCPVVQKKMADKDGYNAVQVGFDQIPGHKLNKPQQGHQSKQDKGYFRILREFAIDNVDEFETGQEITAEIFKPGDRVRLTGTSKGKGFAGAMKRWNFAGLPASHGHEKVHRSTGAIGQCAYPGKVFKGKKMPGQMGNKKVTYSSTEVLIVRPKDNIIIVKGQVPGPTNGIVVLRKQS